MDAMNIIRLPGAWLLGLATVAAITLPTRLLALPMGSQGTWMVMGERYPDSYELSANYALTRSDALGVASGSWEESPHAGAPGTHMLKRDYTGLTYTRLLQRWNLPDAQANLWFVGMLGSVSPSERPGSETLGSLSVLADYETTRVYAGGGIELMRADALRHDSAYARTGFSFYEVEYEDTQPWLIVELKRERFSDVSKTSITPMLRFINKRYFVEVGGNRDGAVLNFMLNF
jgi:hypothetical protein